MDISYCIKPLVSTIHGIANCIAYCTNSCLIGVRRKQLVNHVMSPTWWNISLVRNGVDDTTPWNNNRQHASPHHEVATDVKQMPIRPIIITIRIRSHQIFIAFVANVALFPQWSKSEANRLVGAPMNLCTSLRHWHDNYNSKHQSISYDWWQLLTLGAIPLKCDRHEMIGRVHHFFLWFK